MKQRMSYFNAMLHKLIFVLLLAYGSLNLSQAGVLGGRNIDDQLIKFDVFLGSKKLVFIHFTLKKWERGYTLSQELTCHSEFFYLKTSSISMKPMRYGRIIVY